MFRLYRSKLHEDLPYLWQRPKQGYIHYNDKVWYDRQHIGKDQLERFMKHLSKEICLSSLEYTNHSIRATCITLLDNAQFEARHIIAVTGHKAESSIKKYSRNCSSAKKREMSDALAANILPKVAKTAENIQESEQATTPNTPNFELSNIDLVPLDNEDDDALIEWLNKNPNFEEQEEKKIGNQVQVQPSVTNVQNVQNIMPKVPQVIPKMFFLQSHVVINYNFGNN